MIDQILEDKFVRVDYNKNETTKLPYELDIHDAVNCILSKKSIIMILVLYIKIC